MRRDYYTHKIISCNNNTKKLWKVINEIIWKYKHKGTIVSYISIDRVKTYNPHTIASTFGKFYSNLGVSLAGILHSGINDSNFYLHKIPRNLHGMVMQLTTQNEIERLINQLPNKTSHGHDMISNTLLKSFSKGVPFPLAMIFNQSLLEGKFPDTRKIAEVIPLYKGKEKDCLVNYRPISLLMTTSKLLERVVY